MNFRSLLVYLLLLSIGFYVGYMASLHKIFASTTYTESTYEDGQNHSGEDGAPQHAWQNIAERIGKGEPGDKRELAAAGGADYNTTDNAAANLANNEESYDWQDAQDIVAMFNELMAISEPSTNEEITAFSRAIDEFRATLSSSDADVAILVEYLAGLDPNSKEFGYIVSLVAGLPEQRGYDSLENVALNLAQSNEPESVEKFLDILNTTHSSTDNPEIVSALMDIALYSELADTTKLKALDYLQPFQISSIEKQEIQSNLNTLLEGAPVNEKSTYLNHVLRFSNQDERLQLAQQYLEPEQNQELRQTIIDRLASGTVPRTSEMRERLMTIATSTDDPLQIYAQHTLMYSFDISNEEYQRLNN